jgi:PAS domain S-box-containing protein
LRRYLGALVALFVAVIAAVIWSAWEQSERDALVEARADASYGAQAAATRLDTELAVVRAVVQQTAASSAIRKVFTAREECGLSFAVLGGDAHIDVVRPDGTVVCSSRPPETGTDRYPREAWLADPRMQLSAPVPDARTGRPAIRVTAPVAGLGVVAAFVDLAATGVAMGDQFGGVRSLEILVVAADTTIVTRSADAAGWMGRSVRDSEFVGADAGRDVTGLDRVYARAGLSDAGWSVYAGAARAPAVAAARRSAAWQAIVATAGLLIGLLATMVVYRRIARPIGEFRALVRAARGVHGVTGPVTVRGPREVTELAMEFDALGTTVGRELAQRRQAEETAREHERNYRQMFDASPFPIYLYDLETLLIVEANDAATRYYGHSHAELQAMSVTTLCPADVNAGLPLAGPVERLRQQRHVKADRTVSEVAVTSHEVSFGGRTVRCAVVQDITEREHLEQRLRQSQRLESLGQLAGGVAHDFNNLLGVILGYATMSKEDVQALAPDDPAWRSLLDDLTQIVAAADRATGLTRQLLAFARADAIAEPQVLDVNSVVLDVEKLLRRTIGEDIELVVDLATEPWPVSADPGQLEQVLLNLAVNARDAMPGGGTLTIDTGTVTVDEHYAGLHPGLQQGRYVRLRVRDTGTGMSPATLERAFEPFFTTKPKGEGTGLGLATIYGIITRAGGHAQITSELGHGTAITALLPATDEQPAAPPTRDELVRPGADATILLVEDDHSLRILTERILARHGYRVFTAANAAEALDVAAAHPLIDLLIADVVMPETDGPTMAHALHATHPGMDIIYMSGYTETVLATRNTLPVGATLLNKPVTAHQLLNTVDRAVAARRSGSAAVTTSPAAVTSS